MPTTTPAAMAALLGPPFPDDFIVEPDDCDAGAVTTMVCPPIVTTDGDADTVAEDLGVLLLWAALLEAPAFGTSVEVPVKYTEKNPSPPHISISYPVQVLEHLLSSTLADAGGISFPHQHSSRFDVAWTAAFIGTHWPWQ